MQFPGAGSRRTFKQYPASSSLQVEGVVMQHVPVHPEPGLPEAH